MSAAGKKFHRGVVLCLCENAVAFEPDLHAVPVGALWAQRRSEAV